MDATERPRGTPRQPVVVESQQVTTLWGFPAWVGPFIEPLSTAGLVVVMVIFMLLEREDLRDRLISVIGHGHVSATTKALDEAAEMLEERRLPPEALPQSSPSATATAAATGEVQ